MKKLIMIAMMAFGAMCFAGPHHGGHGGGHNNPPPRHEVHHHRHHVAPTPPPPPPPRVRVWIPTHTVITVNAFGVRISTVIPGHWEFR